MKFTFLEQVPKVLQVYKVPAVLKVYKVPVVLTVPAVLKEN
jgi:hypothetical protein